MKTREKAMLYCMLPFAYIWHYAKKSVKYMACKSKPAIALLVAVTLMLSVMPIWTFAITPGTDNIIDATAMSANELSAAFEAMISGGTKTIEIKLAGDSGEAMFEAINNTLNAHYNDGPFALTISGATNIDSLTTTTAFSLTAPDALRIESMAFYYGGITAISAPKVTQVEPGAFAVCTQLAYVNLPAVTHLGEQTFQSCSALKEISLPQLVSAKSHAFAGCPVLETIYLPKLSITDNYLFESTTAKDITLGTIDDTYTNIFHLANCSNTDLKLACDCTAYNEEDGNQFLGATFRSIAKVHINDAATHQCVGCGRGNHCICGITHASVGDHTAEDAITFAAVSSLQELKDAVAIGGNIYLAANIALTETITIPADTTLKLCLNGHTITPAATFNGSAFYVNADAAFVLTDCGTGSISGFAVDGWGGGVNNGGTFTMYGGTISDNTAGWDGGGIANFGTITIYGGTIDNNTATDSGGGIYTTGTTTIYDVNITGNTVSSSGGGIECSAGTLAIYGGTISNNDAEDGAGVCNYAGDTILKNVTITGNNASGMGGGVYNCNTLNLIDCTISNNTAGVGGGVYHDSGNLNLSGNVQISGNKAGEKDDDISLWIDTINITGALTTTTPIRISCDYIPGVVVKADGTNVTDLSDVLGCFKCADSSFYLSLSEDQTEISIDKIGISQQPAKENNYTVIPTPTTDTKHQWYTTKTALTWLTNAGTDKISIFEADWSAEKEAWVSTYEDDSFWPLFLTLPVGTVVRIYPIGPTDVYKVMLENQPATYKDDHWEITVNEHNSDHRVIVELFYSQVCVVGEDGVKIQIDEVVADQPISGQTSATLNTQGLASGTYVCKTTWDKGTPDTDDDFSIFSNTVEVHGHVFTYTANGSTITATCDCGYSGTATLSAPEGVVYDGTEKKIATVEYSDNWQSGELAVTYTNNINIGTATASITFGGETASVNFDIDKAPQIAPTVSKADETIAGKADGKITGLTTQMEYRKDGESTYTAVSGDTLENLAAGKYFVRFKEDEIHYASAETQVVIAAGRKLAVTYKADSAVVATVEVAYGEDAAAPAIPSKEGYTPTWDNDGKNITADAEINAVYTINEYTITFMDENGVHKTLTYKHGEAVTMPEVPAKDGYTVKWESTIDKATGNATVNAVYTRNAVSDSPQTGDNSNIAFWIALLFVSGIALIALTVVDRRRRTANY